MIVCCVLDRKAGFDGLQVFTNEDIAKRNFAYAINQAGIPNYAPSDFEFYKIGEFDPKTGTIKGLQVPELLMNGLDCVGDYNA